MHVVMFHTFIPIHTMLVLFFILDVEPNECERLGRVPLFVAQHSLG